MNWIQEEDLKSIRKQADIVDIMSRYLALTKKGKNYTAVCPFHDDHDPSLSISTQRQIFKCFVCGTGGNVFTFVQKIEQITFPEAVYKVAEMIHYPLRMNTQLLQPKVHPNQAYFDIMQSYIQYTQYEMKSEVGQVAYQYLRQRKITDEIIADFQIGYAPQGSQSKRFLEAKKYPATDLEAVGLLSNGVPMFQNRIMIPIHDEDGHPIAFTARKLSDQNDDPKYINSSQTKIYEKGETVFNYHRAKRVCRKEQRCILVEGAMDVIAFEKAGIHESVACLGTACTDKQMMLLKRLQVPIYVCYDGDQAGRNATYKFAKEAVKQGLQIQIVKNTTQKDPDEIFDAGGKEELVAFVNKTVSYVDFLFDYLLHMYNMENYEEKKSYAQEIYQALSTVQETFERGTYLSKLKTITGYDFANLESNQVSTKTKKKFHRPVVVAMPEDGLVKAERTALSMIMKSKDAAERFKSEIGFFRDTTCNQLFLYCDDLYRTKKTIDIDDVLAGISDSNLQNYLMELMDNAPYDQVFNEDLFVDAMLKIKECTIKDQIQYLNQKIETVADPMKKAKLAIEKNKLIVQMNELRK